jgi:hypothetical protein
MAEMDDANKSAKIQPGGVFKSAAVTILRMFGRLMTTGEITKYVILSMPSSLWRFTYKYVQSLGLRQDVVSLVSKMISYIVNNADIVCSFVIPWVLRHCNART